VVRFEYGNSELLSVPLGGSEISTAGVRQLNATHVFISQLVKVPCAVRFCVSPDW